jgi:hypothetical protein
VLRTCIGTLVRPEQWKRTLDSVQGMLGACIGHVHLQQQKIDIKEVRCGLWTGSLWLRIETGGGRM